MGHASDPEKAGASGRARHGAHLGRAHERHELRRLHPACGAGELRGWAIGVRADRRCDRGGRAGAAHPPRPRGGGAQPPPCGLESARATLPARLRRHVLRPYRPGRRRLRFRFPRRQGADSRAGDSLTAPPRPRGLDENRAFRSRRARKACARDPVRRAPRLRQGRRGGRHLLPACGRASRHAAQLVPVPGVYLAAVARATKRMRLGPLVYLLPLYSPLRLIEEICILDHLSHGRMEVGVGRGVSPFELKYHKIDHDESRAIFIDAFNCISAGLTTDSLNYSGKYYQYENVPIAVRPLQQPHPAFWYGSSNTTGATWAGEHGMHFVSLGPTPFAKTNIDAFKQALAKRGGPAQPKAEFPGGTAIGVLRHIFVADTDAEAKRFGKPAMELHLAHLNWLRDKHGVTGPASRVNVPRGATFEDCVADGSVIAGTPQRVRDEIERQAAELGVNYLPYLFLGAMTLEEALRSLALFSSEVMPRLAQL